MTIKEIAMSMMKLNGFAAALAATAPVMTPAGPALGLVKVAQAVNQYGSHFDDPGFEPICNVH